jgi:hypothetical protein
LSLRLAFTARDADLIRTYVQAGLGVGVLAEMAVRNDAEGLCVLPIEGLLPICTTWIVLRRNRVLRDYALEFIVQLAPHIDRRDVRRAFDHGIETTQWPQAPHWRDLGIARLPDRGNAWVATETRRSEISVRAGETKTRRAAVPDVG